MSEPHSCQALCLRTISQSNQRAGFLKNIVVTSKMRKLKLGLSRSQVAEICGVRQNQRRGSSEGRGDLINLGEGLVSNESMIGSQAVHVQGATTRRLNRRVKQRWKKRSAGSIGVLVLLE